MGLSAENTASENSSVLDRIKTYMPNGGIINTTKSGIYSFNNGVTHNVEGLVFKAIDGVVFKQIELDGIGILYI